MKKPKKIKIKLSEIEMSIIIQNWLLDKKVSNMGLISIEAHRHIRKFIKGLRAICLSEELQD